MTYGYPFAQPCPRSASILVRALGWVESRAGGIAVCKSNMGCKTVFKGLLLGFQDQHPWTAEAGAELILCSQLSEPGWLLARTPVLREIAAHGRLVARHAATRSC